MKGLFSRLSPEQQKAALAYRGEEDHGDETFKLAATKALEVARKNGAKIHPRVAVLKTKRTPGA